MNGWWRFKLFMITYQNQMLSIFWERCHDMSFEDLRSLLNNNDREIHLGEKFCILCSSRCGHGDNILLFEYGSGKYCFNLLYFLVSLFIVLDSFIKLLHVLFYELVYYLIIDGPSLLKGNFWLIKNIVHYYHCPHRLLEMSLLFKIVNNYSWNTFLYWLAAI